MVRRFPYFFVAIFIFVSCESKEQKEQAKTEQEAKTEQGIKDSVAGGAVIINDPNARIPSLEESRQKHATMRYTKSVSDSCKMYDKNCARTLDSLLRELAK